MIDAAHSSSALSRSPDANREPAELPGQAGRSILPLLVLFGGVYFVQGIVEPTACLPAQPMQSDLRGWTFSAEQIGRFFGLIGIGWSLKPLFGIVSDFLPIGGYRRRPYLLLSTAATAMAFLALAALWEAGPGPRSSWLGRWIGLAPNGSDIGHFAWLLIVAVCGVAMTDVALDALAVETGQALRITGQIQSVQWLALSVAGLLVGIGGGFVAEHRLQTAMFVGCVLLLIASLATVLVLARERRHTALPTDNARAAWRQVQTGERLAVLIAAAAFLFLWNFNPFSSNVLQQYMTEELHFSEQYYGVTLSVQAIGMIAGCLGYFWYCSRVPLVMLIHAAIVAGIISTLTYWLVRDSTTAVIASLVFGFAWQTGTLVQLDLSARICPTAAAGLTFATLMAISNTGSSIAAYLGGGWYDELAAAMDGNRHLAFHALVGIGATFTAGCWLLVPFFNRAGIEWK
jgi:MFS family permease